MLWTGALARRFAGIRAGRKFIPLPRRGLLTEARYDGPSEVGKMGF